MKVLFVNLAQDRDLSFVLRKKEGLRYNRIGPATPLALQILASLMPPGVYFDIVDDNFEFINYDGGYDLVAMHAHDALAAHRGKVIYERFKQKGIPVVIGGRFIQTIPQEVALECADSCVMSEGEYIWKEIVTDVRKNKLQPVYRSEGLVDLCQKDLPLPRRDIIDNKNYRYITVEIARGCYYHCSFCTAQLLFRGTYRTYPIERIERDLEAVLSNFNQKDNVIYLVDEDISMERDYKIELFRRIEKYHMPWIALSNIAVGEDDELLEAISKSGCRRLYIGFESLEPDNLRLIDKPLTHKIDNYKKNINNIHKHNIEVWGLFIFGLDNDYRGVAKRTLRFVKESNLDYFSASVLTPIFKTKLYYQLEQEGRLISKEWFKYWYKVVYQPKNISVLRLKDEFDYFAKKSRDNVIAAGLIV